MPFLLDTDHLSILHRRSQPECDRLIARLEQQPADDLGVPKRRLLLESSIVLERRRNRALLRTESRDACR